MTEAAIGKDDTFYLAKLDTAAFFMQKILPQTSALFASIMAGGEATMGFEEDAF